MSADKPKRIGAGDSGPSPDPTAPVGGGSLVPQPQGLEEAGHALSVGDHFFPSFTSNMIALATQAVHHPLLSPARLLALAGVSKKAGELFFEEALASELTGNRPEAIRLYEKAIEAWRSSFSKDKHKRIAETRERMAVLESDPAQQSYYVAQAAIHWTLYAKGLLGKGKAGEAMDVLKQAISSSQKAGNRLDGVQRNALHALFLRARAVWLSGQDESESFDDPSRLHEAARLIEEITRKSQEGEDPAELASEVMDLVAKMVPEITRYAGQYAQGGWEHKWINFGGMETKLGTALSVFGSVEEWVTDPDDQRKIVTAYRMRAALYERMQAGTSAGFDRAKADELESRWGLVPEQNGRLIGVAGATAVPDQPVAILPALSSPKHEEHLRRLFFKARLLSRFGKERKAHEIYLHLARQAEERGDVQSALELYRMIYVYGLDHATRAALYEKMAQLLPDSPEKASYFEKAAADWWMSRMLAGQRRSVDLIQGPARSATDGESRKAICRDFLGSLGYALARQGDDKAATLFQQASSAVQSSMDSEGRGVNISDIMEMGAELVSRLDMREPDYALLFLDGVLALYFGFEEGIGVKETQRQVAATYLLRAHLRRSLGLLEFVEQDEKNAGAEELPVDDLVRLATLAYTRAQALEPDESRWIPFIGTGGHALDSAGMDRRAYARRVQNILSPLVWDLAESPALFEGTPPLATTNEEELFRRYVRAFERFGNRYVQPADPLTLNIDAEYVKNLGNLIHDSHYFGALQPNQRETLARLLAAHYVREMGLSRPARDFLEAQRVYLSAILSAVLTESGDNEAGLSPEKIYRDIRKVSGERGHQAEVLLDTRLDSLPLADSHQPEATVADFIEEILRKERQAQGIPPPVWTLTALIRLARQKLSSHGAGFRDISNVPLSSRLVDLGVSSEILEFGAGDDLFYYLGDLRQFLDTTLLFDIKQQNTLQDVILAFAGQLWDSRRQPNALDSGKARALGLAVVAMDVQFGGGDGSGGGEGELKLRRAGDGTTAPSGRSDERTMDGERKGLKVSATPTDQGVLQPTHGIDAPIIEGEQSFLDFLFGRFCLFLIRRRILNDIRRSRPPSDEEKRAIADVFEEYRILMGLLGLTAEDLPGKVQIHVLDEDLSKTSHSGYDAYTVWGHSFLSVSGKVDLSRFINRLCHEVWHLSNQRRFVVVKNPAFSVGMDYISGLAVRGLISRKDRFRGLEEAITEILGLTLRFRVAWRRMPAYLSLSRRVELLKTSPILAAGVAYPTQIAVVLRVIDGIAERTGLSPREILIRFASCAAGQGSLLDLLGMALGKEEIQLLYQMGETSASALPIAEKLGLGGQIRTIHESSEFYTDLLTRAFEFSEIGKVREGVPGTRPASPIDSTGGKEGTSMRSVDFPLVFSLFHGLQSEPTEPIQLEGLRDNAVSALESADYDENADSQLTEPIEASAHDAEKVQEWNAELAEADEAPAEIPPHPPLSKGGEGGFDAPEHLSYGDLDGYSSGVVSSPYSRFALSPTLSASMLTRPAAVFAIGR